MTEKISGRHKLGFIAVIISLVLVGVFLAANSFFARDRFVEAAGEVSVTTFLLPSNTSPGTITSSPAGINCPGTCTANFDANSTITFTRTSTDPTTSFVEWFPGINGTVCAEGNDNGVNCTVTVSTYSTYHVNASWAVKQSVTAVISPDNAAPGTVTSNLGGINCPSACTTAIGTGTSITLTANTTNASMVFDKWLGHGSTGGCGTNPVCTFTVGSDNYATASWDWKTYSTNVQFKGGGKGTVSSSPSGISCSSNCSANFARQTTVVLTATPSAGSSFAGWGTYNEGGRSCLVGGGKGGYSNDRKKESACQITMSDASSQQKTTVAYFEPSGSGANTGAKTTAVASGTPAVKAQPNTNTPQAATEIGINELKFNGDNIFDDETLPTFPVNKPIILSGKTVSNGIIKLFIFSTPREATVTANAAGEWTYSLEGLEPGNHHVEAEVTDPAKHTTTKRVTLASFAVANLDVPAGQAGNTATEVGSNLSSRGGRVLLIIGAATGSLLAIIALITAYLWKFKRATFNAMLYRLHIRGSNSPPTSL